jgi:spermidine synthase
LNDGGILFVSTASDENYVSPYLAEYLSSLRKTLAGLYAIIEVVPGVRAGFICRKDSSAPGITSDPIAAFHRSGINSPYFNAALIANRLMPFKTTSFATSINPRANSNDIYKPSSVLHFLKWQGSQFGAKGWVFSLYESPYVFAVFVLLALIPLLETALTRQRFISGFGVSNFGFIGMALEIVGLYLFQMLFGTLYLHIGLMMGVFMVGLAAGAGLAQKLNRWAPFLGASLASLVLLLMPAFTTGEMNLPVAGIVLYILILVAGFTTGGGFAFFANRLSNDSGSGAGLYGADLFGALQAAIFVPGLIMSLGTIGLAIALIVISLVNLVTLRFGNSINLSSV